jgi:hypothetical protein
LGVFHIFSYLFTIQLTFLPYFPYHFIWWWWWWLW